MRKAQKKLVLDFVRTLQEALDEIRLRIERRENAAAAELLQQCQRGAIEMGGLIEKSEGEECDIIRILEEYCEEVYQLHSSICQEVYLNKNSACKKLRRKLLQLEHSIRFEIPERLEVVFLPYKASMWDSLESVWRAADEDEACDAYVIPIPYYDKSPDGSFLKEHWEGEEYPDYVPVTRYDEYDLKTRHPDMILIHNPYDDCNYVTSVSPLFYSDKLKTYTDQLIYIPYFILKNIDPENQAAVEGMKHFCTQPGVVNADKVIVQSEAMRRIYVKVLTDALGGNQGYWENKVLGLGSPKLDKVRNTEKEELDIPKEWLRVIQRPDGSCKRIIFYNTSVVAFLNYNEAMLLKMKDVFRIFREKQDNIALLWRPHPLLESTMKSMRPQLWRGFEEIVRWYREEEIGIYDDSADVDRAIALSDAYYGDESSVARLFQKTGKPAMIQNPQIV